MEFKYEPLIYYVRVHEKKLRKQYDFLIRANFFRFLKPGTVSSRLIIDLNLIFLSSKLYI